MTLNNTLMKFDSNKNKIDKKEGRYLGRLDKKMIEEKSRRK
jgi:hypothetical protein